MEAGKFVVLGLSFWQGKVTDFVALSEKMDLVKCKLDSLWKWTQERNFAFAFAAMSLNLRPKPACLSLGGGGGLFD